MECLSVPVYELVLLQVLTAPGDVPGYVEEVHHGQAGRLLLLTQEGPTHRSLYRHGVCMCVWVGTQI